MKKRTVLCFIVFLLFSALTTSTFVSCGETSATAEPEVKEPVSIEDVENSIPTDEPNEQSILPISSPLEKGYISEETLSRIYDSSVFSVGPITSVIQRWEPVERTVLEDVEKRNIDENYCYSVYEAENGGTLFAFFLRDDAKLAEKAEFKGSKYLIQYVAYVEKPMKMSDFDHVKVGDTLEKVLTIDTGTRYAGSAITVHLCSDGLVKIVVKAKENAKRNEDGTYSPTDFEINEIKYYSEFGTDVEDWLPTSFSDISEYYNPSGISEYYNPYVTFKIDPADYPQE